MKKNKGITLIALVITIIVLLILAGSTIASLTGENGILNKTDEASEENRKQTATEKLNLKITSAQINTYSEKERMPTLKELSLELKEDNEIAYVTEASKIASAEYAVSSENPSSIYTKLKEYPYEFKINSSLQLAAINGEEVNDIKQKMGYPNIINSITEKNEDQTTFSYTGDCQEYIAPENGYYKIECWGASGGKAASYLGGKGAYTEGIIYLSKNDKLYVYVGEAGSETGPNVSTTKAGTFNGGGANDGTDQYSHYGIGGGATDVRMIGGKEVVWDNFESLASRLMVAAGGGGAAYSNISGWGGSTGGYGGAFVGGSGQCAHVSHVPPAGGTQNAGGLTTDKGTNSKFIGKFGKGGDGNAGANASGGGGYYGGAGAQYKDSTLTSGAGGSSFISGYGICNAITSTSTEGSIEHSGNSVHYSGKYFILSQMMAGNENMPNYNSNATMVGNSGNGYARITPVSLN